MSLGRFRAHLRRHNWFEVGVDLAVVVLGILLALQVDGWVQSREEHRLERVYLERLKEDLDIERARMDSAGHFATRRIEAVRLLDRLAADPASAREQPARMPWALETASWRSFPQINAFVYGELQSTGRLTLIRSEPLRRRLAEHYTALQHDARVGQDLSAQQRFDAQVAGLLSIDELAAIEQTSGRWEHLAVSEQRALAIAEALAQRPQALAELPGIVQHHTFNLRVIADMQRRADALITLIDERLAQ